MFDFIETFKKWVKARFVKIFFLLNPLKRFKNTCRRLMIFVSNVLLIKNKWKLISVNI